MSNEKQQKRIFLVTSDKEFARETRAAFADSDLVELATIDARVTDLCGELQAADCAAVVMDVCCYDKGLQAIETERGWPRRSAKLVLRIGLDHLAAQFGLSASATGPRRDAAQGWMDHDARPMEFG
jgi:hypothetical protein